MLVRADQEFESIDICFYFTWGVLVIKVKGRPGSILSVSWGGNAWSILVKPSILGH